MVLLQVLGTNGSGKSTVLRTMAEKDPTAVLVRLGKHLVTVLPGAGVMLVGDYITGMKTPGADAMGGKFTLMAALDETIRGARQNGYWGLAWEGIIIQTRQYHGPYVLRQLKPCYGVIRVTDDLAFDRIYQRSAKPRERLKKNGQIVIDRARGVARLGAWLATQPDALVEEWLGTEPPEILATRAVQLMTRRLS